MRRVEASLLAGKKRHWLGRLSVRGALVLVLLAVLVPVLLVQAAVYARWYQTRRQSELQANTEMARAVAAAFEGHIQGVLRQELAIGIALSPPHALPATAAKRLLTESLHAYPSMLSFSWIGPQGRILLSTLPSAPGLDVRDRDYYRQIAAGREWAVSDLLVGRASRRPTFFIARGVRDAAGRLQGVVLAGVDPDRLREVVSVQRAAQGAVAIIDRRGMAVYRYPEVAQAWQERDWLKKDPDLRRALTGGEAQGVFPSAVGRTEQIGAYVPIRSIGWVARANRPLVEAMAAPRQSLARDLLYLLAASAFALLFALWVGRGITGPVRQLRSQAALIGSGDDTLPVVVAGPQELVGLAAAFNHMRWELQTRADERERLMERLRDTADELQSANEELQAQTEELQAHTEELQAQKQTLEQMAEDLSGERTRLQSVLREAERQNRLIDAIFENILAQVAYLDRDFNFARVNATYAEGCGYSVAELIGKNHFALFPNAENQAIFERVRDTGEAYVARARAFEFADQPERGVTYWDWWLRPIYGPQGTEGVVLSLVDVTAVERGRREVERLAGELREANAAKDQFLALVSHELRNSLAPTLAGVELLRRTLPPDPRTHRTLEIVERSVRLQSRLVNDLLDLSRIARGKIHLQRAPVALDAVISAAAHAQQADAEGAGLTLSLSADPGLWVQGDLDRLEQVVTNLLSNAIKFTPAGGQIRVGVFREPGSGGMGEWENGGMGEWPSLEGASAPPPSHSPTLPLSGSPIPRPAAAPGIARIAVEDTGIGLDPSTKEHLFDMFRQGEVAGQSKPGLGIGLALVKSLVEMHGGRVWAESEGSGKGSRFLVELPLVAGPAAGPSPEHPTTPAQPISVLLVEDNADTRALVADALRAMGYNVWVACAAEEGLEQLRIVRPDLILSDISMPGMDGYEFLRRAREMPGLADVLAFAVTGLGRQEDVRQAREAGYTGHFVKPVDIAALDRRIRGWLAARGSG